MKLINIKIKHYRSVATEQFINIPGKLTLVGPNNSGKTNILKAIQTLFTGTSNRHNYDNKLDRTFGNDRNRASITATFEGDDANPKDKALLEYLDELHQLQGTGSSKGVLNLHLYFTESNTPVYNFFPNQKRPRDKTKYIQYSRTHATLLNDLLNSFSIHYVPSEKSVDQLYDALLLPFLKKKIASALDPVIPKIKSNLSDAAKDFNAELALAGLKNFSAKFTIHEHEIDELITSFDFRISDPHETHISEKGMGIQTTALLAGFKWITKQEIDAGKSVIWLLEEPESYLHPELAHSCNTILDNLANEATVIKTTHSMAFVPQDTTYICGTSLTDGNDTKIVTFDNYIEAIKTIREALGVKFSDFYNLGEFNIFVEGPSDKKIFEWALNLIPKAEFPSSKLRSAFFFDFGGVTHLSGFLRATYSFIHKERICISIFDSDDAGTKERKSLQQYFGQKQVPFASNSEFVSIRNGFAIEGLFPDQWLIDINQEHPNWFSSFSLDADGAIEPFTIKDHNKESVQKKLIERAENETSLDWAKRFINIFRILEISLNMKS